MTVAHQRKLLGRCVLPRWEPEPSRAPPSVPPVPRGWPGMMGTPIQRGLKPAALAPNPLATYEGPTKAQL